SIAMTVVLPAPVASLRKPYQFRIRFFVRIHEVINKAFACVADLWGNLDQPNCRLDRFDLTEEGANSAKTMLPPMLKQTRRLGRDLPKIIRQCAPLVDLLPQFVDDRSGIVLLLTR